MADEVFDSTDMARQLFREGQSVTDEAGDALPHGVIEALAMIGLVMLQICTLPLQSVNPNSYRLTNNSITRSCIWTDVEKQIVLRTRRLIRVRNVRCFRSICCGLRLPGWC